MDALFRKHDRLLANTSMNIIREKMDQIHWNAQIVSIMGPKGVGKSTLIKQYIKQNYQPGDRRVLYCSADTVDFSTRTLVGLAEEFHIHGGELLVIDEIHKYKPGTMDWSREVKEIYELFPFFGNCYLACLIVNIDFARKSRFIKLVLNCVSQFCIGNVFYHTYRHFRIILEISQIG